VKTIPWIVGPAHHFNVINVKRKNHVQLPHVSCIGIGGSPLARALIPDQVIEEGAVQIFILEAVWGNVQIVNTSQVSDQVIERVVNEFKPGQQVQQAQIDTVSLMLSDIHGVDPHFTIKRHYTIMRCFNP
jgi:hypothetical protein